MSTALTEPLDSVRTGPYLEWCKARSEPEDSMSSTAPAPTASRPTFTRDEQGTSAPCYGHRACSGGLGQIGTCDGCHAEVVRLDSRRIVNVSRRGHHQARQYACWSAPHRCNPEMAALVAAAKAEHLAAGQLVKGATVRVVKGRKVAKGTEGVVFWLGTDGYGKAKIGFCTAGGEAHFIAETNVETVTA